MLCPRPHDIGAMLRRSINRTTTQGCRSGDLRIRNFRALHIVLKTIALPLCGLGAMMITFRKRPFKRLSLAVEIAYQDLTQGGVLVTLTRCKIASQSHLQSQATYKIATLGRIGLPAAWLEHVGHAETWVIRL